MRIKLTGGGIEVIKEAGDPYCSGRIYAAGESRLLYHIKNQLNSMGLDLIKKRMWKDGHLVSDYQQYLRTRSPKSNGPHIAIYNPFWAICGADEELNRTGKVSLTIEHDIYRKQGDDESMALLEQLFAEEALTIE